MRISNISTNYFIKNHIHNDITKSTNQQKLRFEGAKDLHLKYILKKRAHLLPERILNKIKELIQQNPNISVSNLPTLKAVHDNEYAALMESKTLTELKSKKIFPEFEDVIDFASVSKQYPKTAKTIANKITPEDFTLDCLKRIWRGDTQENITNHYGFSCRESLSNICKALKIPKPKGNYLILLKTCEEEGNQNVAKKTLKHIETCKKNLEHASKLSKTPEAIAKQRQSNKDYYKDHPEKREIISAISKEVWRRCSDIREAKLRFLAEQPDYVQRASHKLITNQEMNEREKRIAHTFYRDFWNQQPEWKVKFGQTRREVFQEFLNGKLDIKKALEDPEGIK